jgi:hypothetical protein
MEGEMADTGLRNVYAVLMENLKGSPPSSWKMQVWFGKKY